MTRILLIDDLRNFRIVPKGELVIARTSAEALAILEQQNDWDEIWFDHDLGEPDGKLDTTMRVVDFLSERAFNDNPVNVGVVYVHTSNTVGRQQILASMKRYGYRAIPVDAQPVFIVE